MANTENPKPLPRNLASTDSKPIPLTKLGLKIIDNDIKPPKNIKNIWQINGITPPCTTIKLLIFPPLAYPNNDILELIKDEHLFFLLQ